MSWSEPTSRAEAVFTRTPVWLKQYALTAGELGASASQTIMVVLLPLLLAHSGRSALWIGFAVGGEGIFALMVPYWIGIASDHLPMSLSARFGRRGFFLLLSAPVMAAALIATPFLHDFWPLAGIAFIFFAALHGYMTPLWTIMLDVVEDEDRGRVQGARGILRALGLAYGLVGGGLLFSIWRPLPFLLAALMLLVTTGVTWWADIHARREILDVRSVSVPLRKTWQHMRSRPAGVWFLAVNAFWNAAIDGIRPYLFIFATVVIGISVAEASLMLIPVALAMMAGAVFYAWADQRYDRGTLVQIGAVITLISMVIGIFMRNIPVSLIGLVVGGFGMAAIVTLGYPLFANLMGGEGAGQFTGLFVVSVGLGRIVAPMIIGAAVDLGRPLFPAVRGYPMMWVVATFFMICAILSLRHTLRLARRREVATPA
ncbi:MAG: MFS transporter [Longimicrobiales bacterium]